MMWLFPSYTNSWVPSSAKTNSCPCRRLGVFREVGSHFHYVGVHKPIVLLVCQRFVLDPPFTESVRHYLAFAGPYHGEFLPFDFLLKTGDEIQGVYAHGVSYLGEGPMVGSRFVFSI